MKKMANQDRNVIVEGARLNNNHVNFVQTLLKHQFSNVGGLASTFQLSARRVMGVANLVQIIPTRGNHWITLKGSYIYLTLCTTILTSRQMYCLNTYLAKRWIQK